MSCVSAVVLTMGEASTARALASVELQRSRLAEVVVISGVSPFHRALNQGARQVKSEFFIQVDADMVLDADCVESLLDCMVDDVGIVVGRLRDPLLGHVVGVKMFRTACFESLEFPDSVSPDTDFGEAIRIRGWQTVYCLRFVDTGPLHAFGAHEPDYNPNYTWCKHRLEGRRYCYRRRFRALIGHLNRLVESSHQSALIAEVAMADGAFEANDKDGLVPYENSIEGKAIQDFLRDCSRPAGRVKPLYFPGWLPGFLIFSSFYYWGGRLWSRGDHVGFLYWLRRLAACPSQGAKIGRLALCRGLTAGSRRQAALLNDYGTLAAILRQSV